MNAKFSIHKLFLVASVLMLTAPAARAQNNGDQPRTRGLIRTIAPDHLSFAVTDPRSGQNATVTVDASTKFTLGGTDSTFGDVVVPNELVIATLRPNGVADEVTNRNRTGRVPL